MPRVHRSYPNDDAIVGIRFADDVSLLVQCQGPCQRIRPIKYASKHNILLGSGLCLSCSKLGSKNPVWKATINEGYQLLRVNTWAPNYELVKSMLNSRGQISEHRYVMAVHLGRPLESWEHVHHLDGDKLNNEIDNLELLDAKTHSVVTHQEREIKELREEVERLRRGVISLWLLTNS